MAIKEPRKFVPTDQGHADVLNIPITTLYENDQELAAQVESIRSDPAGNGVVPKEAFEQYKQETQTQINTALQTAKDYTKDYAAPKSHTHPTSDLPSASTQTRGIVQLNTSTSSTATDQAATPSAVKAAYDAANAAAAAAASAQSKSDAASNAVGPLTSLLTSQKGSAVAAINELFQSGVDAKNQIVGAVNSKLGVGASTSDPWATIAQKITGSKAVRSIFGFGSTVEWGIQRNAGYASANYPPSYDRVELDLGSGADTKDCYLYTLTPIDLTGVTQIYCLGVQQINRLGSDIARVVVDPVQHGSYSGGTVIASSDIQYHGSGYNLEANIYTQRLTGWYYLRVHARGTSGKLWLYKMLLA
ncbi:phage tail protein [Paenibacillus macerans]|uniref:phage tail protein n=1 Tax=Paenibacillus macerans TaxID=44252 RepID=UPI00203DA3CF|nr:phage tail protein [Paenibacillus macerans]MCM3699181.1 phage tail protein [Paenibacillus macerans]